MPRLPSRLSVIPLLTVAALLAAASPAGASSGWLSAAPLTNAAGAPEGIQTRIDKSGEVSAIWDDVPDNCGSGTLAATRTMGAGWSATQAVSSMCNPRLDMNAAGAGVLVWSQTDYASAYPSDIYTIWASTRASSAAAWSAPQQLSTNTTTTSYSPDVTAVVDPQGNATAVWTVADNSPSYSLDYATASTAGTTWSTPAALLSGRTTSPHPAMAIDGGGNPLLAFQTVISSCGLACFSSLYLESVEYTGSAWNNPAVVAATATSNSFSNVALNVGRGGAVVASWTLYTSSNSTYAAQVAQQTGLTTWAGALSVPGSSGTYFVTPYVAVDSQGNAQIVFVFLAGSSTVSYELHTTTLPSGSTTFTAGSPDPVIPGAASSPAVSDRPVAFDSHDNAILVDIESGVVEGRIRPAGSNSWGSATALSTDSQPSDAVIATDALGNAVATWADQVAGQLESAPYDGAPPLITAFTLPAPGLVGSSFGFTGNAADWSTPVALAWDFGDGQSDSGGSPTHTYANAGAFSAKLTATDALGNASSQTGSVTVDPPPPGPQPGPVGPPPLARPVAGKSFNVEPVGPGPVLVKVPGSKAFVPLTQPSQIQNGAIIDARHGRVRITIDNGKGGLDTAEFYGGVFKFEQPKVKAGHTAFADLYLFGGSFKGCPKPPHNPKLASLAKKKGSVRQLWGSGHGAFRTVGRYSSAAVRGTTWNTADQCGGTLTKVTSGQVGVRDFVLKKTVVVKVGHKYFAGPGQH